MILSLWRYLCMEHKNGPGLRLALTSKAPLTSFRKNPFVLFLSSFVDRFFLSHFPIPPRACARIRYRLYPKFSLRTALLLETASMQSSFYLTSYFRDFEQAHLTALTRKIWIAIWLSSANIRASQPQLTCDGFHNKKNYIFFISQIHLQFTWQRNFFIEMCKFTLKIHK